MSCNRENVIWKSRDGLWSIGFFDYYDVNTDSEDWDHEWDVEYVYSVFNFASVGHATMESAMKAWEGANPGCHDVYEEPNETTDKYDRMAKEYLDAERKRAAEQRQHYPFRRW